MIKLRTKWFNYTVTPKTFPDGTQMLLDFPKYLLENTNTNEHPYVEVIWLYENDKEMFTLSCFVNHIRNNHAHGRDVRINLLMPYVPNARMDRVKETNEIFTLKYFCDFINSLKFDRVAVLDPHSNVTEALINGICVIRPTEEIRKVLDNIEGLDIDGGEKWGNSTIIYFPDDGAYKRYKDLECFGHRKMIYGKKNRDWNTGKILGITVVDANGKEITEEGLKDKVVLMVDDIISYGGTLAYSADRLKELGAQAIYAYASHTEDSVLDGEKGKLINRLDDGVVDELFTTNSIYRSENPHITVIQEY